MWQLKKIATGVGLIILFELLKTILKSRQPDASYYYFFTNLLSCYQFLILLFCIITLFLEELMFKRFFRSHYKILSAASFLVLLFVCEILCAYFLSHPKSIPKGLGLFQSYYRQIDMGVIQFQKACSEYNRKLFYKLRSHNEFRYSNREFSNLFYTNSEGFRDDESALQKPSIIFLGDSYTLGWGVEQDQTYESVVEKITGFKALNAGMSSYGTARESMVLSSLDTSSLNFIVWQYCYNDINENKVYSDSNFMLPIRTEKEYDELVDLYEWNSTYFPGKFFLSILNLFKKKVEKKPSDIPVAKTKPEDLAKEEVRMFLDILAKSKINWNRTKVIVIELNYNERQSRFINTLQNLISESLEKEKFMKNLYPVDITSILRNEDYYVLDLHLNKQGNLKVGQHLAKAIQSLQSK